MNILLLFFVIQMVGLYAMLLLLDYVYEPGSKYLADQGAERKAAVGKDPPTTGSYRKVG